MAKKILLLIIYTCISLTLCACGAQSFSAEKEEVDFDSLSVTNSWKMEYASMYSVDEYGDYSMVSFGDGSHLLVVPENEPHIYNLPENTTVVYKPLEKVYLVSSSAMDMICKIGALDNIKMTGTKENDWYIDEAKESIKNGSLIYAGKYNQPDYELIVGGECDLAIENTMIWHNPETKEKLEELGVPVIVEQSSYEEHPLGRLEWIRLYGLLFDKQTEADELFYSEISKADEYTAAKTTGKKIAFFYITANGAVNIKKSGDYIPRIIEMAGGEYVPTEEKGDDNALSTMNMQFEEFYSECSDADIIIYNSTTTGDVSSISDILDKNPMLGDFKALKDGKVYLSDANFYQKTTGICDMIKDVSIILNGQNEDNLTFLKRLR